MFKKKIKGFSKAALEAIENYDWPGNVRELENKLQKAVITADSNIIESHHLGLQEQMEIHGENLKNRYEGITLKEARKKLEKDLIERVVRRHNGNIKRASEELGISRPTLYDLIDKYQLPVKDELKD